MSRVGLSMALTGFFLATSGCAKEDGTPAAGAAATKAPASQKAPAEGTPATKGSAAKAAPKVAAPVKKAPPANTPEDKEVADQLKAFEKCPDVMLNCSDAIAPLRKFCYAGAQAPARHKALYLAFTKALETRTEPGVREAASIALTPDYLDVPADLAKDADLTTRLVAVAKGLKGSEAPTGNGLGEILAAHYRAQDAAGKKTLAQLVGNAKVLPNLRGGLLGSLRGGKGLDTTMSAAAVALLRNPGDDKWARVSAARALLKVAAGTDEMARTAAIDALRNAAGGGEKKVADAALDSLFEACTPATFEVATASFEQNKADKRVRSRAANALRRCFHAKAPTLDRAKATAFLKPLAGDAEASVKTAAAAALKAVAGK